MRKESRTAFFAHSLTFHSPTPKRSATRSLPESSWRMVSNTASLTSGVTVVGVMSARFSKAVSMMFCKDMVFPYLKCFRTFAVIFRQYVYWELMRYCAMQTHIRQQYAGGCQTLAFRNRADGGHMPFSAPESIQNNGSTFMPRRRFSDGIPDKTPSTLRSRNRVPMRRAAIRRLWFLPTVYHTQPPTDQRD